MLLLNKGGEVMVVAFTGAGISKESGIPTFEDMGNLREKLSRQFANTNPEEYNKIVKNLQDVCMKAKPNDAHKALAEYNIPVITMNIDELHQRAGSKDVIALHGRLPNNIVLYGDPAPMYSRAYELIDKMQTGDVLLVIGASNYTRIAIDIRNMARYNGANIIEIQDNASKKVRDVLNSIKNRI